MNNTTLTLSTILATQLLVPFKCAGCTSGNCASNTVDISSVSAYNDSNGPYRFTMYNLALLGISIGEFIFLCC